MPGALPAQGWYVSSEAGRIRSALDPAAATPSVSLGIRYEDRSTAFRLTAGVPTTSGEALWGGLAGVRRLGLRGGPFNVGVDLLGNAFALFDRSSNTLPVPGPLRPPAEPDPERNGHALAGQLLPRLAYDGLRLQAHVRSGVSRYASRVGGRNLDRSVLMSELQLTWIPMTTIAVSPVVQHYRSAGESAVHYGGISAVTASSSGSLWATLGQWSGDQRSDPQWGAGARWRMHPNVTLEGSARHNSFDPLFLQPPQTSWSVGLSVLLGRAPVVTAPVPAAYSGGRALIRLPLKASQTPPSIAGDFNGWKPASMERVGDHWTYTVAITPGVYHYAFVRSTGEWFVPEGIAGRKSDGMGGYVAVLVVK
jgi:hypothetical protein